MVGKSGSFLRIIIVTCLAFLASCVSRVTQVTETYYETEYRTEYRTERCAEVGKEQREYLTPKVAWHDERCYFRDIEYGQLAAGIFYSGYEISTAGHSKSQLVLTLDPKAGQHFWVIRVYNLTEVGQLRRGCHNNITVLANPYILLSDSKSDSHAGRKIAVDVLGVEEVAIITNTATGFYESGGLRFPGTGPMIERVELMWFEEVAKERQVPYRVSYETEKQRTVAKTEKVPIWEIPFSK